MEHKPYVGVTGFTSQAQITTVAERSLAANPDRLMMAGVLVNNRTLRGETSNSPNRYPSPQMLRGIFPRHEQLLNLVHFYTDEPSHLCDDLCRVYEMVGGNCHGFQLNMPWPHVHAVARCKERIPNCTIVLQCGPRAFDEVAQKPLHLAQRIRDYDGCIDYILLDLSTGRGRVFDEQKMYNCLLVLSKLLPKNMYAGIAGGLHPGNLDRLRFLLKEYEFSIDAEERLRDEEDNLDLATATLFLQMADQMFREYEL